MAITLSDGTITVNLNDDLYWSDENNWHPVGQTTKRSLTGALIVQSTLLLKGRHITLEPEDDQSGAMPREVVDQLRNWAAVAGQELTLTLRGVSRTVIFRHHDGSGFEARPWIHYSDVTDEDNYFCVLRLMEV